MKPAKFMTKEQSRRCASWHASHCVSVGLFLGLIRPQSRPCLFFCLLVATLVTGCGRDKEEVYTDRAKDPAYKQEMTALHDKQIELTAKHRDLKKKLSGMVRTKENTERYDTLAAEEKRVAGEIENARKWAKMRADARRTKELEDREKVKKGLAVEKKD